MGGVFISTLPCHSSAWTVMIPSISHSLSLIHQRLANVTSKVLLEGMSMSQGISIFSVILACTLDKLNYMYAVSYRFLMTI